MPYVNGVWVSSDSTDSAYDSNPAQRQADEVQDQIPIWRGLSGASSRLQSYQDAQNADRNRAYWDTITPPTADQLSSPQGIDAESRALSQLSQWAPGGLTQTDRSALESQRARDAQASRAQQGALQQSAQARGVGGGGLDFVSRLQASQGAQQMSSDAESQALQGAQQRGLAATSAQAQLGSRMREEAVHGAQQQSYEDLLNRAAGATGQYGTDVSSSQTARNRQQQSDAGLLGFLGGLLD